MTSQPQVSVIQPSFYESSQDITVFSDTAPPISSTPEKDKHSQLKQLLWELDLITKLTEPILPPVPDPVFLDESTLIQIRNKSCSRPNFAAKLSAELFTPEESVTSNVSGMLGRKGFIRR